MNTNNNVPLAGLRLFGAFACSADVERYWRSRGAGVEGEASLQQKAKVVPIERDKPRSPDIATEAGSKEYKVNFASADGQTKSESAREGQQSWRRKQNGDAQTLPGAKESIDVG